MLFNILVVAGSGVLCMALRSFQSPYLHRLGTLGIFFTSFLAGWLIAGSVWFGLLFASSWLFLPWLEILTRIRRMRLPAKQEILPQPPPSAHDFPVLGELTGEIEECGFEHVQDAGWKFEEHRQFYRLFYHAGCRTQAAICLVEQDGLAFFYLSFTSFDKAFEREFVTWNYPFSYTLKVPPSVIIRRIDEEQPVAEMLEVHRRFLDDNAMASESLAECRPEELPLAVSRTIERQISHNVSVGVLAKDPDERVRYTVRGMFFLWAQFLRDLVRLS